MEDLGFLSKDVILWLTHYSMLLAAHSAEHSANSEKEMAQYGEEFLSVSTHPVLLGRLLIMLIATCVRDILMQKIWGGVLSITVTSGDPCKGSSLPTL